MEWLRRNSWILLLTSLMVVFATVSAISDPIETTALLSFKKSIGDKNGKLENWQGIDPCGSPAWNGITCVRNDAISNVSHVTEIHFLRSGFTGTLSPQLGNLTYLRTLNLMWNEITGSIPPELGNLKAISLLLLNGNKLTGSIPPELGNLVQMNRLQLDNNFLTGSIPPSFGNLNHLRHMHLNNNSLTGAIPAEIGRNDSFLAHVLVDNNNLTGPFPPSLGVLTHLTIIQVDNNPFRDNTLPLEWFQIPSLIKLSARNCSLTGTVPDLAASTNLAYLDLSMNKLRGTFPSNFSSKLITIDVSENNFVGAIPDTIAGLQDIQALKFAYNHFNGSIPDGLGSAASFLNKSQQILIDLRNNSLIGLNINIIQATDANENVTVRLYGNSICEKSGLIKDRLKLKYCLELGESNGG